MPLLIDEKNLSELKVYYKEKGNYLEFFKTKPQNDEEVKEVSFFFKRADWKDQNDIMSLSFSIDPETKATFVDPYKFTDAKIKVLLKDWTLTDSSGQKIKVSDQNINKMDPNLIDYINTNMDDLLDLSKNIN